ncbi:MAG: dTDP-4-dehydrorhamnose reductase [Clostridiales bacterium]|jgi:dTDP-4-dehydrorhamnose reductase|nr:dTDP-4-dehydrorhamnose reductase [Clostridiales bacterium]
MKIALIGAKGMLGSALVPLLSKSNDVISVDRKILDITKMDRVLSFFKNNIVDIVINCAAYTDVDKCELDSDSAFLVNAIGARNLAVACHQINAAILHVSTDYVFDGEKGTPYFESDACNPINVYGKTKLAGEHFVKSMNNKHYIVRTQWLFGENGKNFVDSIKRLAKEREAITVVNDQYGSPTYTLDLAHALCELIKSSEYGTYHITNSDTVSWYQFACEIISQLKIKNVTVSPCNSCQYKTIAKRPSFGVLKNYFWCIQGHKPLRSFRLALADYLQSIKQ